MHTSTPKDGCCQTSDTSISYNKAVVSGVHSNCVPVSGDMQTQVCDQRASLLPPAGAARRGAKGAWAPAAGAVLGRQHRLNMCAVAQICLGVESCVHAALAGRERSHGLMCCLAGGLAPGEPSADHTSLCLCHGCSTGSDCPAGALWRGEQGAGGLAARAVPGGTAGS